MRIIVACPGISTSNLSRQPWYYLNAVAEAAQKVSASTFIITDQETHTSSISGVQWKYFPNFRSRRLGISPECLRFIHESPNTIVFWATGIGEFFSNKLLQNIKVPCVPVFTAARYPRDLLLRSFAAAPREIATVKSLGLTFILTNNQVRSIPTRWTSVKGLLFQSQFCRDSFAEIDSKPHWIVPPPIPHKFLETISLIRAQTSQDPASRDSDSKPKVSYFGPPLSLRGADLLVDVALEVLTKQEARFELLLRSDTPLLKSNEEMLKLEFGVSIPLFLAI